MTTLTPPEAPVTGCTPPAASVCPFPLDVLRKRAEFLAAARAPRQAMPSMIVQARARQDGDPAIRVGFTCSKKVGNAVARNRAKRRLREAARHIIGYHGEPGMDYVLIGRRDVTAERAWPDLLGDLHDALTRLHRGRT